MARARRKRDRLHQIANWLRHDFPAPRKVELRIERISPPGTPWMEVDDGDCDRIGNRLRIRIDPRLRWHEAVETLFHEWAHAMTWPLASAEKRSEHHGDEWALAYGRLYRAFHDDHGDEWADSYPWK